MNIGIPRVFGVPIEVNVIDFQLKWSMSEIIGKINSTGRSLPFQERKWVIWHIHAFEPYSTAKVHYLATQKSESYFTLFDLLHQSRFCHI